MEQSRNRGCTSGRTTVIQKISCLGVKTFQSPYCLLQTKHYGTRIFSPLRTFSSRGVKLAFWWNQQWECLISNYQHYHFLFSGAVGLNWSLRWRKPTAEKGYGDMAACTSGSELSENKEGRIWIFELIITVKKTAKKSYGSMASSTSGSELSENKPRQNFCLNLNFQKISQGRISVWAELSENISQGRFSVWAWTFRNVMVTWLNFQIWAWVANLTTWVPILWP
jgi:hypothetical protein